MRGGVALELCRGRGGLWATCFGPGFGGGSRRGLLGRLGLGGLGGGFLLGGGGGWGAVLGALFGGREVWIRLFFLFFVFFRGGVVW